MLLNETITFVPNMREEAASCHPEGSVRCPVVPPGLPSVGGPSLLGSAEQLLHRFLGLARLDDADAPPVAGERCDRAERLCEAAGSRGASDPAALALLSHLLEAPEAGRPGPRPGESAHRLRDCHAQSVGILCPSSSGSSLLKGTGGKVQVSYPLHDGKEKSVDPSFPSVASRNEKNTDRVFNTGQ